MDDLWLAVAWAAWAAAMTPLGFMLGGSCSPCCGGCQISDGKPRTDPAGEGTWVPSGDWPNVSWTFVPNDGNTQGETWFFFGSVTTSSSTSRTFDWTDPCNWYSSKTTSPDSNSNLATVLDKRATRLPPPGSIVHIYGRVDLAGDLGPLNLKSVYLWGGVGQSAINGGEITLTQAAHGTTKGLVMYGRTRIATTVYGGVFTYGLPGGNATVSGTVNGGAILNGEGAIQNTVNDGAVLNDNTYINTLSTVNGGAVLNDNAYSIASTINGGGVFNDNSANLGGGLVSLPGVVNGGATFNDASVNGSNTTINGGATFNDTAINAQNATVNGGATFNGSSVNNGTVNNGAAFNDIARNSPTGTVNDGATFNDDACSERFTGFIFAGFPPFIPPSCTKVFVAHPTDLPTCNGDAPTACGDQSSTCGCG